jgi:hypothetical protein
VASLSSVRGVLGGGGSHQKGKQQKDKAKAKSGGGGGQSNKAAAAGSSSGEASTSRGEGSRPSTLPSASAVLHTTVEDAVQAELPSAEAASGTQQPAGGGKKEKERQRKERQRQRKIQEAWEALQGAMGAMLAGARCVSPLWLMCIGRCPPFPWEVVVSMCGWQGALTCGGACGCSGESKLGAVEEATAEAAKHGDRSEKLSALVADAKGMIEQAKTEQAERARVAAEEAATAVAVKEAAAAEAAAERQQMEGEAAALTLRLQQIQAHLGSSVVPQATPAPHPDTEETMCVVCFDAPKDHLVLPCKHLCVCEACAEQLTKTRTPMCPVCRGPIRETMKVFCS